MLNYLLFLSLPTYLLRFSVTDSTSINLLELLLVLSITINFYNIFKEVSLKNLFKEISLNKNIFLPIFLILFGFIFSYLRQQILTDWINWTDGFGKLLDLIILPIIYAFTLLILTCLKKLSLTMLWKSYALGVILISFFGLLYWMNNWLTFDNRLAIFFESPNQLAIFIAPAILIIAYKILTIKDKSNTLVLLPLLFFLLSFILYQTFSLGAWITIIFLIGYLVISSKNSILKLPLGLLTLSLVVVGLICILNIDLFLNAVHYQPSIPATSYDSRLIIYQVSQKIISTNWLYGIGINNFQDIYISHQKYFSYYPQWAVPHAHNNLLHFWVEGGLVSCLGLLLLIHNILTPKNKPSPVCTLHSYFDMLPYLLFIYFILHGLVDTTIWTPAAAVLFFFIIIAHFPKNTSL